MIENKEEEEEEKKRRQNNKCIYRAMNSIGKTMFFLHIA